MTVLGCPRYREALKSTFEEGDAHDATTWVLIPSVFYDDLAAPPPAPRPIQAEFVVGREAGFSDGFMSARHVRLHLASSGALSLEDLGSKNGVFLDGRRTHRAVLKDGDVFEVGHTLFVVRRTHPRVARAICEGTRAMGPTPTRCKEVVELVERATLIAKARENVLILGPAGSGKSTLALQLHGGVGPLVQYEGRGTLEAAIEAATGGTLLIEELTNLRPAFHQALLGALDRLRGRVRLVLTSHRDPFTDPILLREDLLHRVAAFVLRTPSLAARREDLGTLGMSAVGKGASITPAAARRLYLGALPGNIRQLQSALIGACTLAVERRIEVGDLPASIPEPAVEPARAEPPPAVGPTAVGAKAVGSSRLSITQEGPVFTLRLGPHEARLPELQGLRDLLTLVTRPHVEVSALELIGGVDTGDGGEAIDAAAVQAYRARVKALDRALAEAEAEGRTREGLRLRAEREALVDELSRSVGLKGQPRRSGGASERARVSVAMRIRAVITKVRELSPPLAHHLETHVKTGSACVYRPPPEDA